MAEDATGSDNVEAKESRTAWHPMLVMLLERFVPGGWKVIPELLLNRLPQRVDIVIIRLEGTSYVHEPVRKLHSIFDYLRRHTLIEFKGPTDQLEATDALTLLGYGCQYMAMNKVLEPGDVQLMVVADRMTRPFVQQIERLCGSFVAVGNGLWQGQLAGLSLHGVALCEAYKAERSEHLLYSFSKEFIKHPVTKETLDREDAAIYRLLYQQVAHFRKDVAGMALRDIDLAEKSYREVVEGLLEILPVESRLAGLTPEQRLAGLTPEQRFAGLTPEQILAALPPELARKLRD